MLFRSCSWQRLAELAAHSFSRVAGELSRAGIASLFSCHRVRAEVGWKDDEDSCGNMRSGQAPRGIRSRRSSARPRHHPLIWDNLCQASHLVVDLTGLNANVALELGIAHALGRNVLLITQDSVEQVHFPSLAKLRVHRYSLTGKPGTKPLRQALDNFLVQGA